jgi:hypothetical protein
MAEKNLLQYRPILVLWCAFTFPLFVAAWIAAFACVVVFACIPISWVPDSLKFETRILAAPGRALFLDD